jgi:CRP-like cAMP-binding protein
MKKSKIDCDLHSCTFCNQCIKEWLPAIEAHRTTYLYKKGETLFKEGDAVTGIYFLNSGKVKVHSRWDGDKELIIRFACSGDIVGHRGIGKQLVYPITATTLEPASACFIPLDFFEASLKVNPNYMYQLLLFYAAELQESEQRMRNLAHMPVKGRIAHAFLSLKNKFGMNEEGLLDIELSRQDLSSYVGATYETVFRTMSELIEANLIGVSGRQMTIKNEAGLQQLLQEAGIP